jgi:GTPase SAR1 family protein
MSREITDFPTTGAYYTNFPTFTAAKFAKLSCDLNSPKVICVGDPGVGKTCLVNSIKNRAFKDNYVATISVEFISIQCTINGSSTKLAVWDINGDQKPNALTRQFYRGASLGYISHA